MRRTILTAAAVLLLAGCGSSDSEAADEPDGTPLSDAYDTCLIDAQNRIASADYGNDAPEAESVLSVEDDGTRLSVVTPEPGGDLMAGEAFGATECVLEQLDAPSSVAQKMGATTAMNGPQSDSWDDVEVEWSYSAGADSSGWQAFFELP